MSCSSEKFLENTVSKVLLSYKRFSDHKESLFLAARKSQGLSNTEFRASMHIAQMYEFEEPIRQADIAEYLDISPAFASKVISKLSLNGYVLREVHPSDRRSISLVPSSALIDRYHEIIALIEGPLIDSMEYLEPNQAVILEKFTDELSRKIGGKVIF